MRIARHCTAFRGSLMKHAKLPAMKRNAAVVLGSIGTADDVPHPGDRLDDDPRRMAERRRTRAVQRVLPGPAG
jgi:epoxyqueuosine reductase